MAKPKRRKKARSLAAKRGWVTRRKNQRKEFLRSSRASKKGHRKRKAKEKILKAAAAAPKPKRRGKLLEWIVAFRYTSTRTTKVNRGSLERQADFIAIARTSID